MRGIFRPSTMQMASTISGFLCRNLSMSHCRLAVDKGLLSKLRKQTGIPFINCKKALEKFDNDFDQAKQWLQEQAQKEGWARATKLQSRPMSQGLVALMGDHKQITLLEVNCETDFVARNDKFVDMVSKLVQECNGSFVEKDKKRVNLTKDELCQVVSSDNTTLADIVALNVGNLGENMAMRRAAFLSASDDSLLCSYVHPSNANQSNGNLKLGKYGAVVELSSSDKDTDLKEMGVHLCQHIVGMNPKVIGEFSPDAVKKDKEPEPEVKKISEEGEEEGELATQTEEEQDVDELLLQEFLLDTTMTVGELLHENGVEVRDFVRFACGEQEQGEE